MGVLDDKVAIVTGSARGIGRATAELLSEHGAKGVINDLDADVAAQDSGEIAGEAPRCGGGPGSGRAEPLSEHGAKVVINDLDADVAAQTSGEIAGETAVYAGDLT